MFIHISGKRDNGRFDYSVSKQSVLTRTINSMTICADPKDWHAWRVDGKLIQEAMPYLPSYQREFLISGMSIEEQDSFFGVDLCDDNEEGLEEVIAARTEAVVADALTDVLAEIGMLPSEAAMRTLFGEAYEPPTNDPEKSS